MFQVILVAFSFSYVSTFIFQRSTNERLVEKLFDGKEVYYCGYNVETSMKMWDTKYVYTYGTTSKP